jgi:3-deoxy-D-manno-octulosonate 8-phosphate phosphatase (KDO 8-P phosphatase)
MSLILLHSARSSIHFETLESEFRRMPVALVTDAQAAAPIKCILSDVDGVLTDGRIIYDNTGTEIKRFHVRDGLGIKLWMRSGFQFGILTARNSNVVRIRADELGIKYVRQGFENKLPAALEMLEAMGCDLSSTCYIGDDLPDIAVMRRVALAVTPADGCTDAQHAAHWTLKHSGGDGAIRELTERLLRAKLRWEEHL